MKKQQSTPELFDCCLVNMCIEICETNPLASFITFNESHITFSFLFFGMIYRVRHYSVVKYSIDVRAEINVFTVS
jgi:hypothetical protein